MYEQIININIYSIGAPIGAGQVSREKHYDPFVIVPLVFVLPPHIVIGHPLITNKLLVT